MPSVADEANPYRADVVSDGAEDGAGLVAVVLQVVIGPHTQIVRDPLPDAFRIVIGDVRRHSAHNRDQNR